ncbi:MAG: hypothetical protein V9G19_19930 [Tetrasphaera sp.]
MLSAASDSVDDFATNYAWSPDGKLIAARYQPDSDVPYQLYVMRSLDGSGKRVLVPGDVTPVSWRAAR